jgi:two-component system, NarL family, competent response regulator ComA
MIKVLMVDDHKVIASGTKLLLENHGMNVTTCFSGDEALEIIKTETFDIMLFDLKMPDMNGVQLAKKALEICPEAVILIFSGEDMSNNFSVLIKSGVSGVIDKSCSDEQLIFSIKMALEKMVVIPLELIRKIHVDNPNSSIIDDNSDIIEEPLTKLELEIIKEAAMGRTNKEIANNLQMVQRNVEYHLTHIYRKLKVTCRVNAIKKCVKLKII